MATSVRVHTVSIACVEPKSAARFWRDLLGYKVAPNHTNSILLEDPDGAGPALLLAPTATPKTGQNRIHLDLRPDDHQAAIERALALGATPADVGQSGQEPWVVLIDPAGNEFCILQSPTELARWETAHPAPTPSSTDDD